MRTMERPRPRRAAAWPAALALVLVLAALEAAPIGQVPGQPMVRSPDVAGPPAPFAAGRGTLSGVVVSADLGRPVRRASVRLASTTPGPAVSATADEQGRFQFDNVPAGDYTLTASKPGYLESIYGQRKPGSGRPGTPISVAEGQQLDRLTLPLARGGVLAGTVLDDVGEPAFGTEVRALRYAWQNGERTLQVAATDRADDRGGYRIGALAPGEYVVMAIPGSDAGPVGNVNLASLSFRPVTAPPVLAGMAVEPAVAIQGGRASPMPTASASMPASAYAPVYYPGTTSGSSATRITLGIGEERAGLDLQLPLVPLGTVSGTVTSADGSAVTGVEVRLIDRDEALPGAGGRVTVAGPDGRFHFAGVTPGRYRVSARAGSRQEIFVDQDAGRTRVMVQFSNAVVQADGRPPVDGFPLPSPSPAGPPRWAAADVSVTGNDAANVALFLQPGVSVAGRVEFSGGAERPANLTAIRVVLNTADSSEGMASSMARVNDDGRFTIEGVIPGRYRVAVLSPGSLRARSFEVAGEDALDFLLAVGDRDISGATLTLGPGEAVIQGTLQQASGEPAADYTILAFADDPRYWTPHSRRIQATRPATSGRFAFHGLPGGTYRLVAVNDVEDGAWMDPALLRQLAGAAVAVVVGDGETKTQDLRVQTNAPGNPGVVR